MKLDFPAWIPGVIYVAVCFFFPSPEKNIFGFLCALVLYLSATTIGSRITKIVAPSAAILNFPLGLGSLLLFAFAIGSWNASPNVIRVLWIILAALAIPSVKILNSRVPLYWLWGAPFFFLTVWSTFTPTTFYDALAYNLGIPYQYIAYERISTFPTWTTSYFPPFDQITKFLILSIAPQNGIKIFSILLYVHTLRVVDWAKPEDLKSKFLIIPLLLLPVPWILVHIVNPDIQTTFFFVSAVCGLLAIRTMRGVVLSAVLLAFCCWTKYTIYPFVIFVPLLLRESRERLKAYLKKFAFFLIAFLLVLSPLYIRNFYLKNDPLYPLLNRVFATDWTREQTAAVQKEFPLPREVKEFGKRIFLTPFLLTFQLRSYGSASEVGFLPLIGLLLVFFQKRKWPIQTMLFLVLCYLIWIAQLYHFRYFLPVYIIASLLFGYSFQSFSEKFPKILLAVWVLGSIWGIYASGPVYGLFPLLSPAETKEEYLEKRVSYYSAAQKLGQTTLRTIMVGETRNAYIHTKLVPFSYTDPDPLLKWSWSARTAEELYAKLKKESVGYLLYNPAEMKRLSNQYGIWKASAEDNRKIRDMLQKYGKVVFSQNGITLIQIR